MKTFKFSISVATMLFLSLTCIAQNPQKTLVIKVEAKSSDKIILDLEKGVSIKKWEADYIAVFVDINTNITNEQVIEQLIANGRYLVKGYLNEKNDLTIHAPNLKKIIKVNNQFLEEDLHFSLFLPASFSYENATKSPSDILAVTAIK